ncbi:MAG: Mrp/NBP35 family ATP-binding protein [Elusimicrobia bacterium]|nr:Mrp/NBP35 family ATP-binding protein [Elusimicrobiota bacterium]
MNEEIRKIKNRINENMMKIRKKIIILSNKGGVGKTALTVSLAGIFSLKGKKTGLLDADIHGPSIIKAVGLDGEKLRASDEGIFPLEKGNLKVISMGSILEKEDSPVIWRGPLKTGVLRQFLGDVIWGELDFLFVDLPPGTGDEPMSVIQLIGNVDCGIVVTTPQDIALLDTRKCINFLKHMQVSVCGVVENMSGFICPHCGKEIDIFKKGGGEKIASEMKVPFLGRVPFDPRIVENMDRGLEFVLEFPNSKAAQSLISIAEDIEKILEISEK